MDDGVSQGQEKNDDCFLTFAVKKRCCQAGKQIYAKQANQSIPTPLNCERERNGAEEREDKQRRYELARTHLLWVFLENTNLPKAVLEILLKKTSR